MYHESSAFGMMDCSSVSGDFTQGWTHWKIGFLSIRSSTRSLDFILGGQAPQTLRQERRQRGRGTAGIRVRLKTRVFLCRLVGGFKSRNSLPPLVIVAPSRILG